MEGDGVPFGADRIQIAIPGLARVGTQLFRTVAQDQVPGAVDICGSEGLPVMPTDTAPKLKGELGQVGIPRPLCRQIRDNRVDSVLRHVLFKEDQVIEDGHHRVLGRVKRLLVDRHACRAVILKDSEHAALLLRVC